MWKWWKTWPKRGKGMPKYYKIDKIVLNAINFSGTGWNKVGTSLGTFRLTSLAHLPDPESHKYCPKWANKWLK